MRLTPLLLAVATLSPASAAPDPDWTKRAKDGIAAMEYRFSWHEGVLQAPNRIHDFRTSIGPEGFEIVSRTEGADKLRFALQLRSIGRGRSRTAMGAGTVVLGDTRVELRRREGVTEWFLNGLSGLKHGVDLAAPPQGGDGEVVLEFALAGNVTAFPEGPAAVSLRNPQGSPVACYGGLAVLDARGEVLPSRLEVAPGLVRIVFDDRRAAYPVVVDPLATAPVWGFEGNQFDAKAGNAVTTAGDVNGDGYSDLLIGAGAYDGEGWFDSGMAVLAYGGPTGDLGGISWEFWGAGQNGENVGCSVAALGDVNGDGYDDFAVGAFLYDGATPDRGRVYVFLGGPDGPVGPTILEGSQTGEHFGVRVAGADVNGDGFRDLIVGAWGWDIRTPFTIPDVGKVAVYLGGPGGIATSPAWQRIGERESERLGVGLAGLGDVNGDGYEDFAAGAIGWDGDFIGQEDRGAVDVIHGGAGTPSLAVRILGTQTGAQLGSAVAGGDFDGDGYADLAVSSVTWDGATSDEGLVQVYRGGSGGLSTGTPWWSRPGAVENSQLGFSLGTVDANGDGLADLLIGADVWDDWDTVVDVGQVTMYQGRRSGLPASPDWTRTGTQNFGYFGVSVGSAGDVNGDGFGDVIVGEYGFDGPDPDEGRALLFLGSGGVPQDAAGVQLGTGAGTEQYGFAVSAVGDVNGDGYGDAVVGAPYYDNGQAAEGRAFLYPGGPSGLTNAPTWATESNQANALFGSAVAGAGDINGDGYDDVLIGAPWFDGPETNEGQVYPYYGGPFGLDTSPGPTIQSDQAGAFLGTWVSSAGDVDGDGFADVAIGAPFFDVGGLSDAGRLWVCKGSASGIVQPCTWNADGGQNGEQMGSASAAGDFNRDGYSDLLIGAPGYDFIYGQEGRALIYLGGSGGLAAGPVWQRSGNGVSQASADINLGFSVAAVGDVNGDGYGDWVVGAPGGLRNGGPPYEGVAVLYYGAANLTGVFETWFVDGGQDHAGFGRTVAAAGDVNGDGYDDFAVGARDWDDVSSNDNGKVALFLGSPAGVSTTTAWTKVGGVGSGFGQGISAGDFDGDGFSDLLVGAYRQNNLMGSAFVHYGNGGRGARRLGRQAFQLNSLRPVAMLGRTDTTGFNAKLEAGSPAGRSRVAAQVETKPFAVPFDGIGVAGAGSQLMGPGGAPVPFAVTFGALPVNTPHKWRYRVRTANPAFPRTPWLAFRAAGRTQTDFRTVCGQWYRDLDGDGFGTSSDVSTACAAPGGYVPQSGDCNDGNPAIHPGATELCDAVDNDCDRVVDDGAPRPIVTGLVGQKVVDASQYWVGWSWNAAPGATSYDVVRVWLEDVRAIGGFTAAADSACTVDNLAATFVAEDGALGVPPPWSEAYLVGANSVCGKTYDSGAATQAGSRDPVGGNPGACP